MARTIDAVIFDLYGTLLRIGRPLVHRAFPRVLQAGAREWMQLVRGELLVSRYESPEALVRHVCERLQPQRSPQAEARCRELLAEELASIEPFPGVRALLAFLKRRGYALGLLSNLTSAHREPVRALGLEEYFTATAYSCDEGRCKPDPQLYLKLCQRLGATPGRTLVVGDSLANDVLAPRALGFRTLQVLGKDAGHGLAAVSDLGWALLEDGGAGRSLLGEVNLGGRLLQLAQPDPVGDDEQGRYNLVARTTAILADPAARNGHRPQQVFCKRFLFPEAAHVEQFAHEVMAAAGLPVCETAVVDGPEPCLVASRAPGVKFHGPVDPPLAFEVARQCAAAYVFSNADLRPRNAFLAYEETGRPRVTMIDLEHCFFNIALEVDGLADPLRPDTFDRLAADELARRLRRRVLSERSTRRAMRTFVELDRLDSELGRAFEQGWVSAYETMRDRRERLCLLMLERLYREPFLIIGTQAYRRAMARLDVEDVQHRLSEDPRQNFPRLAAVKGGD